MVEKESATIVQEKDEPLDDLTLRVMEPLATRERRVPIHILRDALKVCSRKEWREMPETGSVVHVSLTDVALADEPIIKGVVFHPKRWTRQNDAFFEMEEVPSTHHVRDKRRFRAAVIDLPDDYSYIHNYIKLQTLLDRLLPRLGREKGNSEIEKIAKAAPVFLLAPEGHKEDLEEFLRLRNDLFAPNAVEKGKKGKRYTVGEARNRKESDMPHVNLRENSAKKDYDYLEIGMQRIATTYKRMNPLIKDVKFESEYLGDRSAEARLRHSNNYLRDIKSALSGIGVEIEFFCGCRFARYRERGNIYTDKLGKCPNGDERDISEVPSYEDLETFGGHLRGKSPEGFNRELDDNIFLPESPDNPIATRIKLAKTRHLCPDNCGKNSLVEIFAGRVMDEVSVIRIVSCPATRNVISKNVNLLSQDEFIERYT